MTLSITQTQMLYSEKQKTKVRLQMYNDINALGKYSIMTLRCFVSGGRKKIRMLLSNAEAPVPHVTSRLI